jgi:hypothetical protein
MVGWFGWKYNTGVTLNICGSGWVFGPVIAQSLQWSHYKLQAQAILPFAVWGEPLLWCLSSAESSLALCTGGSSHQSKMTRVHTWLLTSILYCGKEWVELYLYHTHTHICLHPILSDFTSPHKLPTIALNYEQLKPNSYSLTLMVVAIVSPKMCVRFYQTTRRHIALDDLVRTHKNFGMFCTCTWETEFSEITFLKKPVTTGLFTKLQCHLSLWTAHTVLYINITASNMQVR